MAWTAYQINPIDFRWELLLTVDEVAGRLASEAAKQIVAGWNSASTEVEQFFADYERARGLAREVGWEGDFRHPPQVFFLPDEGTFAYAFVWKQENNGGTFIISPRPLAWLKQL